MRPITIFYALVFLSSRMCEVLGIVPNPGLRASNTNNLIYTVCAFSISVQYYFFMYAQQLWWMSLLFAFLFFSFLKRPHQCFTWCISYNFKNSHRQCISVCFDNKSIMMTYKLAWFCFPSAGCVGRKTEYSKKDQILICDILGWHRCWATHWTLTNPPRWSDQHPAWQLSAVCLCVLMRGVWWSVFNMQAI